jgi:hypothetical protein
MLANADEWAEALHALSAMDVSDSFSMAQAAKDHAEATYSPSALLTQLEAIF